MDKGIDESTRMNSWGGKEKEELGYLPGIGIHRKGKFKKVKKPDPDKPPHKFVSSITYTDSGWVNDENGHARFVKIRYRFDEGGNKIFLPLE